MRQERISPDFPLSDTVSEISPRTFGIRQRVALFVGAGLTLGTAILAACGGGGKGEVQATPAATPVTTPTPEATARPQPSPEATAGKPTPTPTERPTPTAATPEAQKPGLPENAPAQVKEFYSRVDKFADKFQGPVAVASFKKGLELATTVDNPNPRVKANREYDNYLSAFGGLAGSYYATGNKEIFNLATDLKNYVATNYSEQYQLDSTSTTIWEIREIGR